MSGATGDPRLSHGRKETGIPSGSAMENNLLDDYEKEIRIRIAGKDFYVPENNTLLRVLQHLAFEISYSRFCWNGDCHNCLFAYSSEGGERQALACRIKVSEGLDVLRLPEGIELN